MTSETLQPSAEASKPLARRDFIRTASLSLFAVTAIAAGAATGEAEESEEVMEWTHAEGDVRPEGWSADLPGPGQYMTYTVNVDDMAGFGYPHGSRLVARIARTDELPPKGSIVLAWIKVGDEAYGRYAVRFVGRKNQPDACFKEVVTLQTDKTVKDFCSCQVEIEAIGDVVEKVKGGTAEDLTAHRLAALLADPETPEVVRDIIRQACESIDCAAVDCDCAGDCTLYCLTFEGDAENVTPESIRRELPAMLRKVGHYRASFYVGGVDLSEPEGGAK